MDDDKKLIRELCKLVSGTNIQRYMLGTKKNGQPRAVYDIVKDCINKKKKKKRKKDRSRSAVDLFISETFKKKKSKKKKKKNKPTWIRF
jgi:hypothetical protein